MGDLREVAGRIVVISGGLAGFAVTGMVLLVTLARDRAEVQTDAFNATVFMFLTAYLFFVSAAFLFAFLPRADADGKQPAGSASTAPPEAGRWPVPGGWPLSRTG